MASVSSTKQSQLRIKYNANRGGSQRGLDIFHSNSLLFRNLTRRGLCSLRVRTTEFITANTRSRHFTHDPQPIPFVTDMQRNVLMLSTSSGGRFLQCFLAKILHAFLASLLHRSHCALFSGYSWTKVESEVALGLFIRVNFDLQVSMMHFYSI